MIIYKNIISTNAPFHAIIIVSGIEVIIWHSDEESCQYEGCLSVPDQSAEVNRYKQVRVQYLDYNGKECEIMAEGLLAIALQHEIDHLDGIVFLDRYEEITKFGMPVLAEEASAEEEYSDTVMMPAKLNANVESVLN